MSVPSGPTSRSPSDPAALDCASARLEKRRNSRWDPTRLARCLFPGTGTVAGGVKRRLPNGMLAPEELLCGSCPKFDAYCSAAGLDGAVAPPASDHDHSRSLGLRQNACETDSCLDGGSLRGVCPWVDRPLAEQSSAVPSRRDFALPQQPPSPLAVKTPDTASTGRCFRRAEGDPVVGQFSVSSFRPSSGSELPPLPGGCQEQGHEKPGHRDILDGLDDLQAMLLPPNDDPVDVAWTPEHDYDLFQPCRNDGQYEARCQHQHGGLSAEAPTIDNPKPQPAANSKFAEALLRLGDGQVESGTKPRPPRLVPRHQGSTRDTGNPDHVELRPSSGAQRKRQSSDAVVPSPREVAPAPPPRPPLPLWSPQLLATIQEFSANSGNGWTAECEPLPKELLDGGAAVDCDDAGVGALQPPLPVSYAPINSAGVFDEEDFVCADGGDETQPAQNSGAPALPRQFRRSYRAALGSRASGRRLDDTVRQQSGTLTPGPSCKAGNSALSSRPTTAGDGEEGVGSGEESTASAGSVAPTSRQSLRSWKTEWTPGNNQSPPVPPPPPLQSAERVAMGSAAALPRLQTHDQPPTPHSAAPVPPSGGSGPAPASSGMEADRSNVPSRVVGSDDAFEAALKRLCDSGAATVAVPPAASVGRWASRPSSAAGARPIAFRATPTQAGAARPVSAGAESPQRAVPRDAAANATDAANDVDRPASADDAYMAIVGATTMRKKFSELALSFTALDGIN